MNANDKNLVKINIYFKDKYKTNEIFKTYTNIEERYETKCIFANIGLLNDGQYVLEAVDKAGNFLKLDLISIILKI